jgi:hypothetical protein
VRSDGSIDIERINVAEGTFLGNCSRCNKPIHRNYDEEKGDGGEKGYYTCSTYCGGVCIHALCADEIAYTSMTGAHVTLTCPREEVCAAQLGGGRIVIDPKRRLVKVFWEWFLAWPWYYGWRLLLLVLILGYVSKFWIFSGIVAGYKRPELCYNPHLKNVSQIRYYHIVSYRFIKVQAIDAWAYKVTYIYDPETGTPRDCLLRPKGKEFQPDAGEGHFFFTVWAADWWKREMFDGVSISHGLVPDKQHLWMGWHFLIVPVSPFYALWYYVWPKVARRFKFFGLRAKVRVARPNGGALLAARKVGGVRVKN